MLLPARLALYFVPMLFSLTVHEWAHALTAHWLGDDTAKERGRLTLNPIPHLDFFGSLLLPGFAIAAGAPVFGWARPTPINAARFRPSVNPRFGLAFTSLAGPFSNLLIGFMAGLLLALVRHSGVHWSWAGPVLTAFMSINAALAVFNVLPIPPLDGSRLVLGLLPRDAAITYARLARVAPLLLVALLLLPALSRVITVPMNDLYDLFATVASL